MTPCAFVGKTPHPGRFLVLLTLDEFGIVVPKGVHNVERLIAACDGVDLPVPARKALNLLADQLVDTQKKIKELTADIRADARANDAAQRLQTIPGIYEKMTAPLTAAGKPKRRRRRAARP